MKTRPRNSLEQLALHVLATARTLGVLREMPEHRAIEVTVDYYRSRSPASRRVMLNDEPIYIAGHVLGMTNQEVDSFPEEVWSRYEAVQEAVYGSPQELAIAKELPSVGGLREQENYSLRPVQLPSRLTPR